MLRSFVVLGRCLNLSQTVKETGNSRQTIRRHINELEVARGAKLFNRFNRGYELTDSGVQALADAKLLFDRSRDWISDRSHRRNGLACFDLSVGDRDWFHAQQHPVNQIWIDAPPLLRRGAKAWAAAGSFVEHKAFKKIRPYHLLYRKHGNDWLCIEMGEKSSYATWMGWQKAKSNLGRDLSSNDAYLKADRYMISAYNTVIAQGGQWYDHVCARFPNGDGEPTCAVNYQRLVSACRFPDGSPVVSVLVARTNAISIDGLLPERFEPLPEEHLMEFDI